MLLSLVSGLALLAIGAQGQLTTTELRCSTEYAKTSARVIRSSTTTSIITLLPRTVTSTTPVVVTRTPPPRISTFVNVATAVVTVTRRALISTFFTTTTSTISHTRTVTFTLTETTRYTTMTSTVGSTATVPAPSGFLNILDTLNYVAPLAEPQPQAQPALQNRQYLPNLIEERQAVAPNNRGFPSAVMCTKFVRVQQIFTTTIRSQTTTNLPARLIFVTQTSTTTSTSIIVPANLRTTQTLTTTTNTWFVDISVATSTTSVIETKTVTQAVATTYAACNPSNALSIFPDGRYVANIVDDTTDPDISAMAPIEGITNASDCCAACQQRYYDCAASFFISDPSSGLVRCSLFHRDDETCLSQHDGMLNIYGDGTNEGFSISLSNGPCGLYVEKTQQNGKT